jgi:hypothetical protein
MVICATEIRALGLHAHDLAYDRETVRNGHVALRFDVDVRCPISLRSRQTSFAVVKRQAGRSQARRKSCRRTAPFTARHSVREIRRARADQRVADLTPVISELRASGVTSLRGIAKALNERGIPTVAGSGRWYHAQVARVLARLAE